MIHSFSVALKVSLVNCGTLLEISIFGNPNRLSTRSLNSFRVTNVMPDFVASGEENCEFENVSVPQSVLIVGMVRPM